MVGDVTPPYPQYFLSGFRRFTKMIFVRSGGTVTPTLTLKHKNVFELTKLRHFSSSGQIPSF